MGNWRTGLLLGLPLLLVLALLFWVLVERSQTNLAPVSPPRVMPSGLSGDPTSESTTSGPAKTSARSATPVAILSQAEVERLLASFAQQFEVAKREMGLQTPRFSYEELTRLREGRLLALVYPNIVESEASRIALDRSCSPLQRAYAVCLLGILAKAGRGAADTCLIQVAAGEDLIPSEYAVTQLAEADGSGRHKAFYLQKSMAYSAAAFKALSLWPDAPHGAFLRDLVARGASDPAGTHPIWLDAKSALTRHELLLSSDWQVKLSTALSEFSFRHGRDTRWAIQASRIRGLPWLKDSLRKRVDDNIREAKEYYAETARSSAVVELFERDFLSQGTVEGISDPYHDDLLVALAELGAPLNDLERRRLRHFGYACDPGVRLAELLDEKR